MKTQMNEKEMLEYIETLKMELRETKYETGALKSNFAYQMQLLSEEVDSVKLSRNVFAAFAAAYAVAAGYLAWGVL